jgi:RNA polymerase sigma-70 factor, ECF subfamily
MPPGAEGNDLDDWFTANLPRIRAFVERQLGGRVRTLETSADVVQSAVREVLVQFARSVPPATIGLRWRIYRQAVRKIIDKHRYHEANKRLPEGRLYSGSRFAGVASPDTGPLGTIVAGENLERLAVALQRLPEHYRNVVVWTYVDGLPHAEVGLRLGKSEDASKMLLMRAMVKLGEELDDRED